MDPKDTAHTIKTLRKTIQLRNEQNTTTKLLIQKLLDACPAAKDLVAPSKKDGSADCRWAHKGSVAPHD